MRQCVNTSNKSIVTINDSNALSIFTKIDDLGWSWFLNTASRNFGKLI